MKKKIVYTVLIIILASVVTWGLTAFQKFGNLQVPEWRDQKPTIQIKDAMAINLDSNSQYTVIIPEGRVIVSKDRTAVYWAKAYDSDTNTTTFELLDLIDPVTVGGLLVAKGGDAGFMLKDKNGVYTLTGDNQNPLRKIPNSDGLTFREVGIESDYGQGIFYHADKNNVYRGGTVLSGVDPNTFVLLGGNNFYARDAQALFFKGERVIGADPNSFVLDVADSYGLYTNGHDKYGKIEYGKRISE